VSEEAKALDQFYTNPKIAERFVKKVDELYDFSSYDHVIEPSMGEGFIYDYLPPKTRIGLDIQKNHPDCVQGDFFDWNPEKSGIMYEPLLGEVGKSIFVGNPPFGRASNIATEFFHHAAKYSDAICFIIPRSWMRIGMHNRLPADFGLYFEAVLPDKAFIFNGKQYEVRCVAQCWSRFDPCPNVDGDHKEDWREMSL
jgi:hypothetical protein